MFTSVLAVVSTLAASVVAGPNIAAREVLATWPADGFEQKCFHPGGCTAVFNIKAPAEYVHGAPAFSAICHPLSAEQDGTPNCEAVTDLAAGSYVESVWEVPSADDLVKISVFHIWNEGDARYNASGSVEFPASATSFEVPVTSMTAVL
ncbi:hypothetical protein F5Y00DRAFT_260606 [Daldinia vernicosa]|uniref:uncharacterized protein n=1 Tax=Daldinia vernicosa TaxID=114800 RepID=UPI0020086E5A|nr:uncharacterized protein F5Y00DRAFT_260606 [Daldinia vernicosa]KAI0850310.1 hypothetical protein F5Y00DRAFT_260606 [Daldinia vernicosa]